MAIAAQSDEADLIERGWAKLPPSYRVPADAPGLPEARRYCRRLAESHYENFHVVTRFLPRPLRPHFHALYAYCRIADDLGDEVGDPRQSLALLALWGRELDACYEGRARHPVFVALADSIRATALPKEPLADLLSAFRQDQAVERYASMDELLDYCRRSANPVGRLVLHICGEGSEDNFRLSDATCTALQLANFWQDVAKDYARGRIYLPQDDLRKFGVDESVIARGSATPEFRALLRHEVAYARRLFAEGRPLVGRVRRDLAVDLDLFSRGGLEILRAIERRDGDVLSARPSLSRRAKAALAARAVAARMLPFPRRSAPRPLEPAPAEPAVREAYAACVEIARRKAKNFYYAFAALDEPRLHAICSIYAFMRRADDLADDEDAPLEARRGRLAAWTAAWREASNAGETADPVFIAVRDAVRRYAIPPRLLDELIEGVRMDLAAPTDAGDPLTFATAAELHRYCYRVASVVGLVCIRIFGFRDPRAEQLAEDTGIAFQLTNILRDVAEDAARNRLYLPLEDLRNHGLSAEAILRHGGGAPPTAAERAVLAEVAARAERFYASAQKLLPLIDRESRPALWGLVSIYRRLLQRIQDAEYDVFSRRVRVPTMEKIGILAASRAGRAWARMWPGGS